MIRMGVMGKSARQKTISIQGSEAIKTIIPALSYHIYKCRHRTCTINTISLCSSSSHCC